MIFFLSFFPRPEADIKVTTKNNYPTTFLHNLTFIWTITKIESFLFMESALHWDLGDKSSAAQSGGFFIPFVLSKDTSAGRRHRRWCKTCISSCNCASRESGANHRSITCLDGFTRKFFLHNSQMLTSVQQLLCSYSLEPILNSFMDCWN